MGAILSFYAQPGSGGPGASFPLLATSTFLKDFPSPFFFRSPPFFPVCGNSTLVSEDFPSREGVKVFFPLPVAQSLTLSQGSHFPFYPILPFWTQPKPNEIPTRMDPLPPPVRDLAFAWREPPKFPSSPFINTDPFYWSPSFPPVVGA